MSEKREGEKLKTFLEQLARLRNAKERYINNNRLITYMFQMKSVKDLSICVPFISKNLDEINKQGYWNKLIEKRKAERPKTLNTRTYYTKENIYLLPEYSLLYYYERKPGNFWGGGGELTGRVYCLKKTEKTVREFFIYKTNPWTGLIFSNEFLDEIDELEDDPVSGYLDEDILELPKVYEKFRRIFI